MNAKHARTRPRLWTATLADRRERPGERGHGETPRRAVDRGAPVSSAPVAWRFRLQGKLILSYLVVGAVITLCALFAARTAARRGEAEDASRAETLRASMRMASTLNSAFEEGFSYALSQDPEEKANFFRRIEGFREYRRALGADPNIDPEQAAALAAVLPSLDEAVSAAHHMFADAEDDGHVSPASYKAYEAAMDDVVARLDGFVVVLEHLDARKDAEARQFADRSLLAIGALAVVLAALMGNALGRRITRPLLALRSSAIAFARGQRDVAFDVSSTDEVGELGGAIQGMARNVNELLATVDLQKTRLDNVFASMQEMLFVCDEDGVIVSANRSACAALGFEENELVGTTVRAHLVVNESAEGADGTANPNLTVTMRAKGGREFVAALSMSALPRSLEGEPGGFVCVAQDLTERRRLEEGLRQAQRLESLGRFTAGIAHEMGSPLSAVRASLSIAKGLAREYAISIGDATVVEADHAAIAKELEEALGLADSGAERVCGFVRSIRAQTRGTTEVKRARFDAIVAIRDALNLVGHAAVEGRTKLHFQTALAHAPIDGTPGRIEQVVTNLVGNAIYASAEKGGGLVAITLERTDGELVLRVADDGPGIAAAVLPRIFEPLFTTKPIGKGTGLGLAIVHDIVKGDFGGSITVSNRAQGGAEFAVHIPSTLEP
jgi:PAS domain S-box-containing protein